MMFTKSLSLLVVSLLASASGTSLRATDGEELSAFSMKMSLHDEWTKIHSKVYATEEETMERLKIWIANHGMLLNTLRWESLQKVDFPIDSSLGPNVFD